MACLDDVFADDPESLEALFLFGRSMLEASHPGIARVIYERLTEKAPGRWQNWNNLGRAWSDLNRQGRAEHCHRKVLELSPGNVQAFLGLSNAAIQRHAFDDAIKWADEVLKRSDILQAHINKAFAYLHKGELAKGWPLYARGIGEMEWRTRKIYGLPDGNPEPEWNGEKDATLIVTGEQGIGDQIAFMSALPDILEDGVQVAAIDCYPKLRNLFARNFPDIPVHGDMFKEELDWTPFPQFTHSVLMSKMHGLYRQEMGHYRGHAYLSADPERVVQWDALLKEKGDGPRIGIAWTGGRKRSYGWRTKSENLDFFAPLFEAFPTATFVSLEYREPDELPGFVHHWPRATITDDYEDTAGLVAALDAVVSVPTSVNHLAGALGIPAYVLANKEAHFHYSAGMPYYNSVNVYRRGELDKVIADLKVVL